MMQLLLKLDKKLDEQKIDSNVKYTNLNDKFEEQSVMFDEIKDEIKSRNSHFDKRIDKMHAHFDKLTQQTVMLVRRDIWYTEE